MAEVDPLTELLGHLQASVAAGDPHAVLALKVQNIRAEHARSISDVDARVVEAIAAADGPLALPKPEAD